jgi:hypothetical protein
VRPATAVRLVLGVASLVYPVRVLDVLGGHSDQPRILVIVRILAGRLLVQGMADLTFGPRIRLVDVAIDTTHAASMVAAARRWPDDRRAALVSGALASGIALLDLRRPTPR